MRGVGARDGECGQGQETKYAVSGKVTQQNYEGGGQEKDEPTTLRSVQGQPPRGQTPCNFFREKKKKRQPCGPDQAQICNTKNGNTSLRKLTFFFPRKGTEKSALKSAH